MSFEHAIEFESVTKAFSVDIDRARKNTLRRVLFSPFFAKDRLLPGEVFLFRDLSFRVRHGERVAVLAGPGAGKTTLLNMMLRLSPPTYGAVRVRGRARLVQGRSSVERPLMSLRTYVKTLASLCGAQWDELDPLSESVLGDTGTQEFAAVRIKNVDPDDLKRVTVRTFWTVPGEVFLFDEGDYRGEPLSEEALKNKTVVFATSQAARIPSEIERCLVVHAGALVFDGPTKVAQAIFARLPAEPPHAFDVESLRAQIREWERLETELAVDPNVAPPAPPPEVPKAPLRKGNGIIRIKGVRFRDLRGNPCERVPLGSGLEVIVGYSLEADDSAAKRLSQITVVLEDEAGRRVVGFPSEVLGFQEVPLRGGGELSCRIPSLPMLPGKYLITVSVSVDGELADKSVKEFSFEVEPGNPYGTGKMPISFLGPIWLSYTWKELDAERNVTANLDRETDLHV